MNPTVIVSPAIERSAELRPVVEQATGWLLGVLRGSHVPVTAEWGLIERMSTGEQWVELHLIGRDPQRRFSGLFTPDELRRREFAESAFRGLMLNLLRWHTDELLEGLREPTTESAVG